MDELIKELRSLKGVGQLAGRVTIIENFMAEFDKLLAFPKLVRIRGKQQPQRIRDP